MPELKSKSEETMIEMQDLDSDGKAIGGKTGENKPQESTTSAEAPKEGKKKSKFGRKLRKFFGADTDVDSMSEDEFRVHLLEMEYNGEAGYSSNYDKLVEELQGMPSLMALAKQAEKKDVAEAVEESPQTDSEDKKSSKEAKAAQKTGEESENETAGKKAADMTVSKAALRKATKAEEKTEQGKKKDEESDVDTETAKNEAKNVRKKEKDVVKKIPEAAKEAANKGDSEETGEEAESSGGEEKSEGNAEEKAEENAEENAGGDEDDSLKSQVSKMIVGDGKEDESDKDKEERKKKVKQINALQDSALNLGSKSFSSIGDIMRTRSLSKAAKNADSGSKEGRRLQYASYNAKKNMSNGLFDVGQGILDVVNKVFDIFGSDTSKKIAKLVTGFVSKGMTFGKEYFAKRIEKKAAKNGLKGILGGSNVYKKLKTKYKMHAPDMRRAIRTAARHNSVSDLVNADKDKLKDYDTSLKTKGEMTDEEEMKKLKKKSG